MNERRYTEEELAYINKLMAGGMDRTRAEWYLNAMQRWTKEDYENYIKYHLDMFGIEDDKESPQ